MDEGVDGWNGVAFSCEQCVGCNKGDGSFWIRDVKLWSI
jgi:hypothetical protein